MSQEMRMKHSDTVADVPKEAAAPEAVPQFYIPATESIQTAWPHTLKHGNTFALFDDRGDILIRRATPPGCSTTTRAIFPGSACSSTAIVRCS